MRELIAELLLDREGEFPEDGLGPLALDDGAAIPFGDRFLVVTTDSHVISPRFFPGGDIGRLSVAGTVNDLAVMGATDPLALTCALVVEEGFDLEELARIQASIHATCREAGARVVTGDTKVMGRGEVDGLVVNTTGIGFAERVVPTAGLRPGDRILVSGTVGDHGLAVLAVRNDLQLDADLRSDVAPVNGLVAAALEAGGEGVVALTDPTRGGFTGSLHEMATGVGIVVEEGAVPLSDAVRAAGELLGIDPLQMANEGKVVLGVDPRATDAVLAALRAHPLGAQAEVVGTATADQVGRVILDTGFGRRLLAELDGEIAPRIC
jgi:hydrogenase expression/formation protein HypE